MVWGWLWGFAGMILAVPMMVIIKISCENIPYLEPISILLGSRRATLAVKAAENSAQHPVEHTADYSAETAPEEEVPLPLDEADDPA
jgi:hypothetical protein